MIYYSNVLAQCGEQGHQIWLYKVGRTSAYRWPRYFGSTFHGDRVKLTVCFRTGLMEVLVDSLVLGVQCTLSHRISLQYCGDIFLCKGVGNLEVVSWYHL